MKIKDWPENERPRERFYEHGSYVLSDTELLAIVIGKGVKDHSALDLARETLSRVGSLKKLAEKSAKEIENLKIPGLGRAKIITILSALELGRRSYSKKQEKIVKFTKPQDLHEYYSPLIGSLKQELFKVAAVDGKNSLLKDTTISKGILDASLVHPREVFKFAIIENASGIFLVHNHPSGVLKPSEDDLKITDRLKSAGELLGIKIIDHIIVAEEGYYSFSEHNLL